MRPINFNNNDRLPKEALIPYKKKHQAMTPIENKQRERIINLQAIIRHCDCPVIGNPRFEMVIELTKKDKIIAEQIAELEQQPKESTLTKQEIKERVAMNNNFDSFKRAIRYTFNRELLHSEEVFINKLFDETMEEYKNQR